MALLASCGPGYYIKRAIATGAKGDTLRTTRADTAAIQPFTAHFAVNLVVNPTFALKPCQELSQAVTPAEKSRALTRLQEAVCPEVHRDSVYNLDLEVRGKHYQVPLRTRLDVGPGGVVLDLEGKGLKLPVVVEENAVSLRSGYTAFQVGCGLLLALCVGAVLSKIFWR